MIEKLSVDLVQEVETGKFAFGNRDHEQASPTQFAVLLDAGLEGDVAVAEVDPLEHALGGEGFFLVEVAKGTVGTALTGKIEW